MICTADKLSNFIFFLSFPRLEPHSPIQHFMRAQAPKEGLPGHPRPALPTLPTLPCPAHAALPCLAPPMPLQLLPVRDTLKNSDITRLSISACCPQGKQNKPPLPPLGALSECTIVQGDPWTPGYVPQRRGGVKGENERIQFKVCCVSLDSSDIFLKEYFKISIKHI